VIGQPETSAPAGSRFESPCAPSEESGERGHDARTTTEPPRNGQRRHGDEAPSPPKDRPHGATRERGGAGRGRRGAWPGAFGSDGTTFGGAEGTGSQFLMVMLTPVVLNALPDELLAILKRGADKGNAKRRSRVPRGPFMGTRVGMG
jgi:hypothetical protein